MTAQVRDSVLYEGERCCLAVTEHPFKAFLEQQEQLEWGMCWSTAHQLRRYSCSWEVEDDRLYLTGVSTQVASPYKSAWAMQGVRNIFAGQPDVEAQVERFLDERTTMPDLFGKGRPPRRTLEFGLELYGDDESVAFFFPGQSRALATWFTGELCVPCGTPDWDMEGWWTHRHPYCIYLTIERGIITARRKVLREERPENQRPAPRS